MDCIFCKIISGDIPSTRVFESERLIVIEDVNPQAPTHLLVIPKKHYDSILDCDDDLFMTEAMATTKELSENIGIDKKGFRLVINTNAEGGQTVFHLHIHLMGGRQLTGQMG
jgi:histidine triad (HIT) family protein